MSGQTYRMILNFKKKDRRPSSSLGIGLKQSGNVFLALFGAVAVVGLIGGTAAGIMKGPMKSMSDVSARAKSENEIMANTKMAVMAIANLDKVDPSANKDCDNDGTIEAYPFSAARLDTVGPAPVGGGYLPSEIDTTRWHDAWGNSYTYCIWDHGTLIDDAACGGAGQNRLQGFDTNTYPPTNINKQTFIAILSAGPNRRYETTCQDWSAADTNADGDLDDVGDTPLAFKPDGSDDLVMSYTYAEAAMATSSNWRISSGTTDTAEIPEEDIEIGGMTSLGDGVKTTVAGGVDFGALGGLKLAADPGDDSMTGACNPANEQALRINTGGSIDMLEICVSGLWQPISNTSVSAKGCTIETLNVADGGNAWIQHGTNLYRLSSIDIEGNYAYLTGGIGDRVTVVDLRQGVNPTIVGSVDNAALFQGAAGVDIQGQYAYVVATGSDSLSVVDISDPTTPVVANSGNAYVTNGSLLNGATDVKVQGNFAYVAANYSTGHLTVIDISDPLNPAIANGGSAYISGHSRMLSIEISGNYLYAVAGDHDRFNVFDISDPLNPAFVTSLTDAAKLDYASDLKIVGDYAYVVSRLGDSLTVIDISDPLNPVIADGGNAWITDSNLNGAYGVDITQNYALVSTSAGRVTAVDITDPLNPVIANEGLATLSDPAKMQGARDVQVLGRYAYVTGYDNNTLTVIDLNCDPEREEALSGRDIGFEYHLGNCLQGNDGPALQAASISPPGTTGGNFANVTGDDDYIYFSDGNLTAYSFDGYNLTEVATMVQPRGVIWSDGTYIYLNEGADLNVYSFDGINFNLLDTNYNGVGVNQIWGDGDHIYITYGSVIEALTFDGHTLSTVATSPDIGATDFWVHDGRIYANGTTFSIFEFDGSSFNTIYQTSALDTNDNIYVDDNYIYTSDWGNLKAWKFEDNELKLIHHRTSDTNIFYDMYGDGRYLYVQYNIQSRVMDFDGEQFNILDSFSPPGSERGRVYHDGNYFYVPSADTLSVYSGYECTKAGFKTPGNAITKSYDTNQFITQSNDTALTAESYGTSIFRDSDAFADEAGMAFNVSSVLGDDEIPSAAITVMRESVLNDAASLVFKTQDDDGQLKSRMAIDSKGNLGLDTSAPFGVSANLQIGDLASNGSRFFDPELGNCIENNGGPFVELTTNGAALTGAADLWTDNQYVYVARGATGLFIYTFDGETFVEIASDATFTADSVTKYGNYIYAGSGGAGGVRVYSFDGTTLLTIDTIGGIANAADVVHDGQYIYAASYTTPGELVALSFDGTTITEVGRYNDAVRNSLAQITLHKGYIITGYVNSNDVVAFSFDGTTFTEEATYSAFQPVDFWSDSEYIYVANTFQGLDILKLENGSFSLIYDPPPNNPRAYSVWGDGVYIYTKNNATNAIEAYTFNGTALSLVSSIVANGSVRGDGNYIYAASSVDGIKVLSGFECTKVDGWVGPDQGLLTSDPNIVGFDSMASNCTAANNGPLIEIASFDNNHTNSQGIIADSLNVYPSSLGGIRSYASEDEFETLVGNRSLGSNNSAIFHNDIIISARNGFGLNAFTKPDFSYITSNWNPGGYFIRKPWSDGRYIYAQENSSGSLLALSHDGTTFAELDSLPSADINHIGGYENYIYTASGAAIGITANIFDGTTLTQIAAFNTPGSAERIWAEDDYIYVAEGSDGIRAYTFDGSVFVQVGHHPMAGNANDVWGDGQYIYVAGGSDGLVVLSFDGTAFNVEANDNSKVIERVWGDGQYIYAAESATGINYAYSGFECTETDGSIQGAIGYFGLESETDPNLNILYSTGFDIKGTSISGNAQTDILTIDTDGTTTITQDNINIEDEAAALNFLSNSDQNIFNTLELNRYRGNINTGTIVQDGDLIGGLTWGGYSGDPIFPLDNAAIYAKINGAVSPSTVPIDLILSTDNAGLALNSSDITISSSGNIGINTDSPAWPLHSNGRISVDEGFRVGFDNQCSTGRDLAFLRYNGATLSLEHCGGDGAWSHISQPIRQFAKIDPRAANCLKNNGGPLSQIARTSSTLDTSFMWGKDGYVYVADGVLDGIKAMTFDGTTFIDIASYDPGNNVSRIWIDDDNYIYVTLQGGGISVLTFDGTAFTEIDSDATHVGYGLWGDGNYIYTTGFSNGLTAYTFNGTTLTVAAHNNADFTSSYDVWGDGTYLYVADHGSGLDAVSFNGTSFTVIDTYDVAGGTNREKYVWGDDDYIYVSVDFGGLAALTFNGVSFTEIDRVSPADRHAEYLWSDGTHIYISMQGSGPDVGTHELRAYSFDGASLSLVSTTEGLPDDNYGVWGDGQYIYIANDEEGGAAYLGFECLVADNPSEQIINWAGAKGAETKIVASDGAAGDRFGYNVALNGNYALIGAWFDDDNGSNSGSAYIFDVTTGTQLHKITPSDGAAGDIFSRSVALNGNYAIISAVQDDDNGSNSGSAYIFDVTTGTQLHKITASDGTANDRFGESVALNGNYAIIGNAQDDDNGSNSGSAYIFDVTTGTQLHKITASDGAANDAFGNSVALDGNYAIIGAISDDDNGSSSGSAYIFDVTTGTQLHKITPSDGAASDQFGNSVALDGNYALIGAALDDDNGFNSGSAYIFDVTTGTQLHKITPSDGAANDRFGILVALNGNYAIIGSIDDDDNGLSSGSAYIFDVTTGTQLHKITPSDSAAGDRFGELVALNGNYALIGATNDDDNGIDSGSAYIYRGQWNDRYRAETTCFPNPMFFDNITNAVSNSDNTTDVITITGALNNCPISLASESGTIDIIKNAVSVGGSQTTINNGDTIQLEIRASATAGASLNNILTIGDQRAMFSVTTAP